MTPDPTRAALRLAAEAARDAAGQVVTPLPWATGARSVRSIVGLTRHPDIHWNGRNHTVGALFMAEDSKYAAYAATSLPLLAGAVLELLAENAELKRRVEVAERALLYAVEYAEPTTSALATKTINLLRAPLAPAGEGGGE